MEIYEMLHKTMWFGIAAELLVNPKMYITDYKCKLCEARNELPLNYCFLCHEFKCIDCPLTVVGFSCGNGWYGDLTNVFLPLHERFYYALRCATIGAMEEEVYWIKIGIDNVLKVLALKTPCDEIKGLTSLYGIVEYHIDIDVTRRRYYCDIIKARLAKLGEVEGWSNVDET